MAHFLLINKKEVVAMKIAIPVFGTRVSPRFTCTDQFLLVEAEKGEITQREIISVSESHPLRCTRILVEKGVDVIICGGINRVSEQQLDYHNIMIFSWINGEVEEVLDSFLKGDLLTKASVRPVGSGRRRRGMGFITGQCRRVNSIHNYKEVNEMPNRDGTGPNGKGPGTGRGKGPGKGGGKRGAGRGRGQGGGGGRGAGGGRGKGGSGNNEKEV